MISVFVALLQDDGSLFAIRFARLDSVLTVALAELQLQLL